MNKLEALFDAVIVKPIENEEEIHGNIIVPDMGKEKNEFGEIVAIGTGRYTLNGDIIPMHLKVGDKVVLPTQGFTKLPFNGEEYYVGPENQVLAKVATEINVSDILDETEVTNEDKKNLTEINNK
jgi:chaperonin GroES